MSIDTLFYGLEAFDEDVAEDASTDPIQQLEEENTANEAVAEMNYYSKIHQLKMNMLIDKLNEAKSYKKHIEKYGVDRTFLSLVNRDNRLSNYLNMNLPSCESFDTIGDYSSSQLTLICAEAFDGIISKIFQTIWKVVCAICKFIFGPFIALWKWIFNVCDKPTPKLIGKPSTNQYIHYLTKRFDDKGHAALFFYGCQQSEIAVIKKNLDEEQRLLDYIDKRLDEMNKAFTGNDWRDFLTVAGLKTHARGALFLDGGEFKEENVQDYPIYIYTVYLTKDNPTVVNFSRSRRTVTESGYKPSDDDLTNTDSDLPSATAFVETMEPLSKTLKDGYKALKKPINDLTTKVKNTQAALNKAKQSNNFDEFGQEELEKVGKELSSIEKCLAALSKQGKAHTFLIEHLDKQINMMNEIAKLPNN